MVTGSSVGCISYEDGASYQGKVKPAISPSPAIAGEGLTTVRETRLLAGLRETRGYGCGGAAKGAVVLERGDHAARLRDLAGIDLRENIARRLAAVRQDLAPGIDDERMAVGALRPPACWPHWAGAKT